MDAAVNARNHRQAFDLAHGLVGAAAAAGACCLVAVAILLSIRRTAGGLHEPLPESSLLVVGLVAAGLALALRLIAWCLIVPHTDTSRRGLSFAVGTLPAVPLVAIAGSLSLPGTSALGLVALWAPIVAGEGAWMIALARWPSTRAPDAGLTTAPAEPRPQATTQPLPDADTDHPPNISQHIQRGLTEDSHDSCFGWVRTTFKPGQRTETIHLTFCPPFAETPQFRVDQLEGPPMQIKQAQVLPYGARLELRLSQIDKKQTEAVVEFSAIDDLSSSQRLGNNGGPSRGEV